MKPSRQIAREISVFAVVPPNVLPARRRRADGGPAQGQPRAAGGSFRHDLCRSDLGGRQLDRTLGCRRCTVAGAAARRRVRTAFRQRGGPYGKRRRRPRGRRARAEIVAWLKRVVRPSIAVASICSGALLAARAGLLDRKACTTHHASIAELRRLAPLARVEDNGLFVIHGERLTSAGVTSGVDLMLHVVGAMTSPAVAVAVARYLVVYLRQRRRPATLALAGGTQSYPPGDPPRARRDCERSGARLAAVEPRARRCDQFAQSLATVQSARRHVGDDLRQSHAGRAGAPTRAGVATRHRDGRRTRRLQSRRGNSAASGGGSTTCRRAAPEPKTPPTNATQV